MACSSSQEARWGGLELATSSVWPRNKNSWAFTGFQILDVKPISAWNKLIQFKIQNWFTCKYVGPDLTVYRIYLTQSVTGRWSQPFANHPVRMAGHVRLNGCFNNSWPFRVAIWTIKRWFYIAVCCKLLRIQSYTLESLLNRNAEL